MKNIKGFLLNIIMFVFIILSIPIFILQLSLKALEKAADYLFFPIK